MHTNNMQTSSVTKFPIWKKSLSVQCKEDLEDKFVKNKVTWKYITGKMAVLQSHCPPVVPLAYYGLK